MKLVPIESVKQQKGKENLVSNVRIDAYIKIIKMGYALPPLIVDDNNQVLLGAHTLAAYRKLKRKKIWIDKGNGKFPYEALHPYKDLEQHGKDRWIHCFVCDIRLEHIAHGQTGVPMPSFPFGIPSGPIWYCAKCGMCFKKDFTLWRKI